MHISLDKHMSITFPCFNHVTCQGMLPVALYLYMPIFIDILAADIGTRLKHERKERYEERINNCSKMATFKLKVRHNHRVFMGALVPVPFFSSFVCNWQSCSWRHMPYYYRLARYAIHWHISIKKCECLSGTKFSMCRLPFQVHPGAHWLTPPPTTHYDYQCLALVFAWLFCMLHNITPSSHHLHPDLFPPSSCTTGLSTLTKQLWSSLPCPSWPCPCSPWRCLHKNAPKSLLPVGGWTT